MESVIPLFTGYPNAAPAALDGCCGVRVSRFENGFPNSSEETGTQSARPTCQCSIRTKTDMKAIFFEIMSFRQFIHHFCLNSVI